MKFIIKVMFPLVLSQHTQEQHLVSFPPAWHDWYHRKRHRKTFWIGWHQLCFDSLNTWARDNLRGFMHHTYPLSYRNPDIRVTLVKLVYATVDCCVTFFTRVSHFSHLSQASYHPFCFIKKVTGQCVLLWKTLLIFFQKWYNMIHYCKQHETNTM